MKEYLVDSLKVKIMPNRTEMGEVAAKDIHDCIVALLEKKPEIKNEKNNAGSH